MTGLRSTGAALLLAAVIAGCGETGSPVGEAPTSAPAGKLAFNTHGVFEVVTNTVEVTQLDGRTVSAEFDAQGGTFLVEDLGGRGKKDDLRVSLTIPPGVLEETVTLTMQVIGDDVDHLVVAFRPEGYVFRTPVDMQIDLGNDLAPDSDLDDITPYHMYADGSVEDAEVYYIDRTSHTANIYLKVPGFSRYGLRD